MSTHPWQICCTLSSVILEGISLKLCSCIESTSSINPIDFQVRTPKVNVTVIQNKIWSVLESANGTIYLTY